MGLFGFGEGIHRALIDCWLGILERGEDRTLYRVGAIREDNPFEIVLLNASPIWTIDIGSSKHNSVQLSNIFHLIAIELSIQDLIKW